MSVYRLNSLLAPNSVALVGASPRSGSVGRAIIRNLRAARFLGPFGVVNSHYREVDDISTVKCLAELPFVPELVIITTPAPTIPEIVAESGRLGCAGAIIVSAGLGHGAGSLAEAADRVAQAELQLMLSPAPDDAVLGELLVTLARAGARAR